MPDHYVAFWNLENLFGPEDHEHRIEWIKSAVQSDLIGWTPALYAAKLDQLATVIAAMNGGAGPDILGVCEVEDAHVLLDLVDVIATKLAGKSLGIIHANSDRDRRGIDTAFLYDTARFSVDPDLVFNHFVLRRTGTRDILQATFRSIPGGNDLVVLTNHWPSRSGGAEASAGFRATAGETLGYWHQRILEEAGPETPVLAIGDFNDDPFDPSVRYNARAWRERGDVERGTSPRFYNFAWEYLVTEATDHQGNPRMLDGSLYYRNDGNIFDQILANRYLLDRPDRPFRVVDGSAGIFAHPPMVSHRVGEGPRRFGLPKGDAAGNVDATGFSDHFPVSVLIREADTPVA